MKTKKEIVANWLPRYTGLAVEKFGKYILLTNFNHYVELFARLNHVELIGEYKATLTDAQLDYLKNSFAEADYFSFANVYSAQLTDLPTTFLYHHNGRESLKVTDYWGAPQELKDLENEIEKFIGTLEWQKAN